MWVGLFFCLPYHLLMPISKKYGIIDILLRQEDTVMNQLFLEDLNTLSQQMLHIPFGKEEQEKLLAISEIKMYK